MKKWTIIVIIALIAAGVTAFLLFGYKPNDETPQNNTPVASSDSVSIENFSFNPKTLTVKQGQTVMWTNNENSIHTIVSNNQVFESAQISRGGTFQFTFTERGNFDYHCGIHPSMVGTVIVE